ncbi:hypothetical protein DRQ07_01010 [candidate division KSB1 bacterium]|nr:MAG: hypothetical protein DRQ07_01010 [candidate division KSB1 bacterium]
MKNVRSVYKKLKEVKYHYLIKFYKKYLSRVPKNCKYNYPYKISEKHEIGLCLCHQPELDLSKGIYPNLIDVCYIPEHCTDCNAFINKYTKEDIKRMFEEELKDQKIKSKKYPDICALEWVLEQSVIDIPTFNYLQKIYFFLKKLLLKRIL